MKILDFLLTGRKAGTAGCRIMGRSFNTGTCFRERCIAVRE
jgi:hypothetical protein